MSVSTNGSLWLDPGWMEGSQDTWLSLGGLVFPGVAPGWPSTLVNGWSNLGGAYAEAKYTLVGSLCFLDGVIKDGSQMVAILYS